MQKTLTKKIFLYSTIVLTNALSAASQPTLSNLIWESTSSKQVRGTHYQDYASMGKTSKIYADMFFQTTLFRGDSPSVRGGLISEIDQTILGGILGSATPIDATDFNALTKKITLEEETLGAMLRFRGQSNEITFGMDIPVICQLAHLYTSKDNVGELTSLLSNVGSSATTPLIPPTDIAAAKDLATTIRKDFGVGDLRLFAEREVVQQSINRLKCHMGAEILIPFTRPESAVSANLKAERNNTFETFHVKSLSEATGSQAQLEYKAQAVGSLLKNIFHTMHRTKLKAQADNYRAGVGIYINPQFEVTKNFCTAFATLKGNYLLAADSTNVFALANNKHAYDETIEAQTHSYPYWVAHCTAGLSIHPRNFEIKGGYDFFFKSQERILNIKDTWDNTSTKVNNTMNVKKTERAQMQQHRIFGGIGYTHDTKNNSVHCSLMLNAAVHSIGAPKDWGAALGVGTVF